MTVFVSPTIIIHLDVDIWIYSLLQYRIHFFIFMDGEGGITKQCVLDVISIDRGPNRGVCLEMLLDKYQSKMLIAKFSALLLVSKEYLCLSSTTQISIYFVWI